MGIDFGTRQEFDLREEKPIRSVVERVSPYVLFAFETVINKERYPDDQFKNFELFCPLKALIFGGEE